MNARIQRRPRPAESAKSSDPLLALLPGLRVSSPFPFALNARRCLPLDLGLGQEHADAGDAAAFQAWIETRLAAAGADYAAGGYGEQRGLYGISDLFGAGAEEPRSVHLGIDLWLAAGTPVHAVLPGVVHSTRDNAVFGDYGPTVILEHSIEGQRFYTLYGHLARRSLELLRSGQEIARGAPLGWLGEPRENVGWAPHLHFQIIRELDGRVGDFPGVCKASEQARWQALCPDPNLLLRIRALRRGGRSPAAMKRGSVNGRKSSRG